MTKRLYEKERANVLRKEIADRQKLLAQLERNMETTTTNPSTTTTDTAADGAGYFSDAADETIAAALDDVLLNEHKR